MCFLFNHNILLLFTIVLCLSFFFSVYINYIHKGYSTYFSDFFCIFFNLISLYSLNKSFTETNSIKVLEFGTSIVINLCFSNNTILSCFFFSFYFIINLCFSCIPTAGVIMPTGTQINEGNAENGTQIIIVEDKISKYSVYFKYLHVFLYFLFIKSLSFI